MAGSVYTSSLREALPKSWKTFSHSVPVDERLLASLKDFHQSHPGAEPESFVRLAPRIPSGWWCLRRRSLGTFPNHPQNGSLFF